MQRIAASREGVGHEYAHVVSKYRQGIVDEELIPKVAAEGGWTVITSDKGRQPGDKHKMPQLCLDFGVRHVMVSQTILKMKLDERVELFVFSWPLFIKAAEDDGLRYSMKLLTSKRLLARGVGIDLIQPKMKGNNVIKTVGQLEIGFSG
jgi:hypothetical protein